MVCRRCGGRGTGSRYGARSSKDFEHSALAGAGGHCADKETMVVACWGAWPARAGRMSGPSCVGGAEGSESCAVGGIISACSMLGKGRKGHSTVPI